MSTLPYTSSPGPSLAAVCWASRSSGSGGLATGLTGPVRRGPGQLGDPGKNPLPHGRSPEAQKKHWVGQGKPECPDPSCDPGTRVALAPCMVSGLGELSVPTAVQGTWRGDDRASLVGGGALDEDLGDKSSMAGSGTEFLCKSLGPRPSQVFRHLTLTDLHSTFMYSYGSSRLGNFQETSSRFNTWKYFAFLFILNISSPFHPLIHAN